MPTATSNSRPCGAAFPEGCGFAGFARAMGEVRGLADEEGAPGRDRRGRRRDDARGHRRRGRHRQRRGRVRREIRRPHRLPHLRGVLQGCARWRPTACGRCSRHPRTSRSRPTPSTRCRTRRSGALCAEGTAPLSIHFMESPAEAGALFAGRGPLPRVVRPRRLRVRLPSTTAPRRTPRAEHSRRRRPLILVHACCVGEEEVRRILAHFTAPVYWCLCPRSNRYISRLAPPVALLRFRWALASASAPTRSPRTARSRCSRRRCCGPWRGPAPRESLRFGPRWGGAEALGLDDLTPDTRVKPLI